jgi:hypothetical protein
MLDPNDVLVYTNQVKEQDLKAMEEMSEWLKSFLADDDDYDIFSK